MQRDLFKSRLESAVADAQPSHPVPFIAPTPVSLGASPFLPPRLPPSMHLPHSVRPPLSASGGPKAPSSLPSASSLPSSASLPAPLQWNDFFDAKSSISIDSDNSFTVYTSNPSSQDSSTPCPPTLILLHGGGMSSLSWSLCAKRWKESFPILAIDFRAHGETECTDELDLSSERLVEDVTSILTKHLSSSAAAESNTSIILIGHSLGGAIAVRAAAHLSQSSSLPISVAGVIVLDVVEGTAMHSLQHMRSYLENRPARFPSIEKAIHWAVHSNAVKNPESARISIPSQLVKQETDGKTFYIWRTNLQSTEPHWNGWFRGLSDMFLSIKAPKLLLLAGTDRLDKPLTIGQMQGKFQMALLYGAGHTLQEDVPDQVVQHINDFVRRFSASALGSVPVFASGSSLPMPMPVGASRPNSYQQALANFGQP